MPDLLSDDREGKKLKYRLLIFKQSGVFFMGNPVGQEISLMRCISIIIITIAFRDIIQLYYQDKLIS